MKYERELEVAKDIARQSGKIMKHYFFADNQGIQRKADNSPVTHADIEINHLVIQELAKHFPEDGVIGEEQSTADYGMGRRWICDPLDGTKGFTWGSPTSMFSLALVIDGVPVMGVVYDPYLDLMYWGEKGQGSYCNEKKLQVSRNGLQGGFVALTSSVARLIDNPSMVQDLAKTNTQVTMFSGAVYKACLVARGRLVGYVEGGIGAHDMAAMQVIVEEAGGKITKFDGETADYSQPFKSAVVSNGRVHAELLEMIKNSAQKKHD
jgi:fructose-1,6-bisphosphatase/inositol monophosphatase family enzyme